MRERQDQDKGEKQVCKGRDDWKNKEKLKEEKEKPRQRL